MVSYLVASAASAPPPRGLPFAKPTPRASSGSTYVPPALSGENSADALDEDAQPAFAPVATAGGNSFAGGGGGDDDGPPLDVLEAQMSGEVSSRDGARSASSSRTAHRAADEDEPAGAGAGGALPDIDVLAARLSAEVRGALEELFRAKFVGVKKLPKKVFGSASARARADAA